MFYDQKLDIYQKESVYTNEDNVLIVAPPGSGKTTVIVNRTAHLINSKDINPENIAIITFTKAAALNMKKRYIDITSNKKSPFFGTFHALFYKILCRHEGQINIINGTDAYKLISSILTSYLDSISDEKVKEVLNDISLFKNNYEDLEHFIPKIDKSIFRECISVYENYKKEKGLMDFDDLQINIKSLFLHRPILLDGYRKLFKYILVDEFQDCDKLQIELLQMIGKGNSIFAVGDEDQCIYGFRGSRPDCMVDFEKHFKDGKKIFLRVNYRSVENIVNLSKNVIQNNKNRNAKIINWNNDKSGIIKFFNAENERQQSERIAENINKLINDSNCQYGDIAILYRTNVESRSIIDTLLKKEVPFKLLDREYDFFDHFICKDILAYLKLSIDVTDKESFVRIINKPFRYISRLNIEKIRKSVFKESCFELLKSLEDLPIFQIKSIEKLEKDILKLNKMYLKDAINYIIKDLGYHDYIDNYSQRSKIDIEELNDIIEEFKESAEEYMSSTSFLVHVGEVKERLSKKSSDENSVILSTIHGVKGMEFKNVFIINCNEGIIPHINNIPENIEEERRLFYVGITRAIDNLSIFSTKVVKGKGKETSRFIKECGIEVLEASTNENELKEHYKIGDYIVHKAYGQGKVSSIEGKYLSIIFNNGVERKFDAIVLKNSGLILEK